MVQITQKSDNTYIKGYSQLEVAFIQELKNIRKNFLAENANLWISIGSIDNRVTELEKTALDTIAIQNTMNAINLTLSDHTTRIQKLEASANMDTYSKDEMHKLLVPWKVEEISHVFETPTNAMFDEAEMKSIKMGYVHYPNGDIDDAYGFEIGVNIMRRYSIWAYCDDPRITQMRIRYADKCVVLQNKVVKASYTDSNGNFDGTAKVLTLQLPRGWSKLEILVANQSQEGGLVIVSDIASQADTLTSLDYLNGRFTGEQIAPGTIKKEHFSNSMELELKSLIVSKTGSTALKIGNPNSGGIMEIGDGVIKKSPSEPFIFNDGLRINGEIYINGQSLSLNSVNISSISSEIIITEDDDGIFINTDLSHYITSVIFEQLQNQVQTLSTKLNGMEQSLELANGKIGTLSTQMSSVLSRLTTLEGTSPAP